MWIRFLVKQLLQTQVLSSSHSYEWYEIAFITHWCPGVARVILCLDVPATLQSGIRTALSTLFLQGQKSNPYSGYVPLIYEIITLYDHSVWSLRDAIRTIEKVSLDHQSSIADRLENNFDAQRKGVIHLGMSQTSG